MSDEPANRTFLALIEDAFERLLEEPEAREHLAGFASGVVAFVVTRDGLEVRRRTELGQPRAPAWPGFVAPCAVG